MGICHMPRFFNMKKSTRGNIRKSPSAISWVVSLSNIAGGKAVDAGSVIKQWILDNNSFLYTNLTLQCLLKLDC